MLEPISNIHPDWKTLYRKLRINNEIVDPETFTKPSSSYSYKNMHLIEKNDEDILWTSITAVGRPCEIEFQSTAKFNRDGSFVKGKMNKSTFKTESMGLFEVKTLFSQAKYNFSNSDYWDVISNEKDESILKHFKVPSLADTEGVGETASEYDHKGSILKTQLFIEIEQNLSIYRFDKAEDIFTANQKLIPTKLFESLVKRYKHEFAKYQLLNALKNYNFEDAEKIFTCNKKYIKKSYFKQNYEKYTLSFNKFELARILSYSQYLSLTSSLKKNNIKLPNKPLTYVESIFFILDNLILGFSSLELEERIFVGLIKFKDELDEIRLLNSQIYKLVERYVTIYSDVQKNNKLLWNFLCCYPDILQNGVQKLRYGLDSMASDFPWNNFEILSKYYIPNEEHFFRYINQHKKYALDLYNNFHHIIITSKYYNSLLILALLKEKAKISDKDVIELLKMIVEKTFEYNSNTKTQISNLIFPSCISEEGFKHFSISDKRNSFCEGKLTKSTTEDGSKIVMCRNRKCEARSNNLTKENDYKNQYFLKFIKHNFKISEDSFFNDNNFVQCMGALNRWNEIVEHLFCGYGKNEGCGAPLIFQPNSQVKPGKAAYATTFWHCSNHSCSKYLESIKISHCKGCHKIIDSRIDTIRCPREDIDFYVCNDCGYCCSKHKVSGICPSCGYDHGWDRMDDYQSRYQCKNCSHIIKVPVQLKDEFGKKW